jgi:catechol 2,3-dioxygenase-like lactoylglutathione lyase family enzyme
LSDPDRLPSRLHHTAYVVRDLGRTRAFYEDVIGLPLAATYVEQTRRDGAAMSFCHCFFGLADGSALAFFQFTNPADTEAFLQKNASPFVHVAFKTSAAIQQALQDRLAAAACPTRVIDHGYCRSLYATDPDGLNLEFTVDSDAVDPQAANFARAHEELARFLAGDTTPNNPLRAH